MKVKIKDLKPNPHRDLPTYPIDKDKVRNLVNSIDETGFWDNLLARNNVTELNPDGEVQLMYGHHRLFALWEKYGKDSEKEVDIPVKEFSDIQALKILAEENNDYYLTNIKVINETIRRVWEYLVLKTFLKRFSKFKDEETHGGARNLRWQFVSEDVPEPVNNKRPEAKESKYVYRWSVIAWQIAWWLGKNWGEEKVWFALDRLQLIGEIENLKNGEKKEIVSKKAVESLPNQAAADNFVKTVKSAIKTKSISLEQQNDVAKGLNEKLDYKRKTVQKKVFEKQVENMTEKEKKEEKEKGERRDFEKFLKDFKKHADKITEDLAITHKFRDLFDSDYYLESEERRGVFASLETLCERLIEFIRDSKGYKESDIKRIVGGNQ